ncbi:nidogen-like domain-containing protein [Paludisphaera sp.]|uniref:nidogen-like domain-containing protein n=1 Tax=Paludisphaera sp. TaxID=2017432 RepID=UPI00301C1C78
MPNVQSLGFAALRRLVFGAVALGLAAAPAAHAAAVVPGFNSNTLPRNDDGSTGLVSIGFDVNFYGENFSQLYVNNNGNVTFDAALGTFTPFPLTDTARQIIAPFFADVDTRGSGSAEVTYGAGTFDGRQAFGVNWVDVGYFGSHFDKLNSFQLILVDRSDTGAGNFDIIFNYDQIQWETGDASQGSGGLGGFSARVGYSNGTGDPGTFFELPGSAVNGAFLDSNLSTGLIYNSIGSDVDGRYIFNARNGTVIPTIPEPASLVMSGMAALVGATIAWRRRRPADA